MAAKANAALEVAGEPELQKISIAALQKALKAAEVAGVDAARLLSRAEAFRLVPSCSLVASPAFYDGFPARVSSAGAGRAAPEVAHTAEGR